MKTIPVEVKTNQLIVYFSAMFRRMLVPGSPLLSAAVIAKSSEESADIKKEKKLICKPSELPIYTSLVDRWLSVYRKYF